MLKRIITPQKLLIKSIIQRKHGNQLMNYWANKKNNQKSMKSN